MLKKLTVLGAVIAVTTLPLPVNANMGIPKVTKPDFAAMQAAEAENAKLKATIASMQKRISALSSRLQKLERKSASSASSDGSAALAKRLARLEAVIRIKGGDVQIRAGKNLKLEGSADVSLKGAAVTVDGSGIAMIKGGVVMLGGKGGRPVARVGDRVVSTPVGGAGKILQGSPTVLAR